MARPQKCRLLVFYGGDSKEFLGFAFQVIFLVFSVRAVLLNKRPNASVELLASRESRGWRKNCSSRRRKLNSSHLKIFQASLHT